MDFVGTGIRLSDIDLPRIGDEIGVGEDEIHAVLDVECRGRGFDSQNRPAMLFEPHIFYKHIPSRYRGEAVKLGLARAKWKRDYPSDSYPRLEKAMAYDVEAALKSCSWGLGQVMGFNHDLAGYPTARAMVEDFKRGEAQQLAGMVSFIKNTGLDAALRDHDWRAFAKGYNGSGYATHGYHTRLEAAYRRWLAIPDTDWKRTLAVATVHRPPTEPLPTEEIPDQGIFAAIAAFFRGLFS